MIAFPPGCPLRRPDGGRPRYSDGEKKGSSGCGGLGLPGEVGLGGLALRLRAQPVHQLAPHRVALRIPAIDRAPAEKGEGEHGPRAIWRQVEHHSGAHPLRRHLGSLDAGPGHVAGRLLVDLEAELDSAVLEAEDVDGTYLGLRLAIRRPPLTQSALGGDGDEHALGSRGDRDLVEDVGHLDLLLSGDAFEDGPASGTRGDSRHAGRGSPAAAKFLEPPGGRGKLAAWWKNETSSPVPPDTASLRS